jgi:hypothetical protein
MIQGEIRRADSFLLFWSRHARASVEVEREWRYALSLGRKGFIKPVYWEREAVEVPPELARIHFQAIKLPSLG